MSWSFAVKLVPGEEIVDEGSSKSKFGVKAEHTPILTNLRVMFKFNTLSSGLVQSFHYDEITEAAPATRLMIKYLKLTADGRYHYLKVNEPEVWATKIIASRDKFKAVHVGTDSHATPSKSELLEMLDNLRTAGVMTEEEVTDKRRIVLG